MCNAGTAYGGVFRSTDNGANWAAVNTGLTNTDVYALAINDSGHIFVGIAQICDYYGCSGGGVFRSTDNGANWTATGLTNTDVQSLAVSGTNLFAGTLEGRWIMRFIGLIDNNSLFIHQLLRRKQNGLTYTPADVL